MTVRKTAVAHSGTITSPSCGYRLNRLHRLPVNRITMRLTGGDGRSVVPQGACVLMAIGRLARSGGTTASSRTRAAPAFTLLRMPEIGIDLGSIIVLVRSAFSFLAPQLPEMGSFVVAGGMREFKDLSHGRRRPAGTTAVHRGLLAASGESSTWFRRRTDPAGNRGINFVFTDYRATPGTTCSFLRLKSVRGQGAAPVRDCMFATSPSATTALTPRHGRGEGFTRSCPCGSLLAVS